MNTRFLKGGLKYLPYTRITPINLLNIYGYTTTFEAFKLFNIFLEMFEPFLYNAYVA